MALAASNPDTNSSNADAAAPALDDMLRSCGVPLDPTQLEQLAAFRDLLYAANQTTNLTAVRDRPGIERRLILESLRLVGAIRDLLAGAEARHRSLIDLGTGGGLPGLVLAIACPDFNVFLLDATGKKVAFLDSVVAALGLRNTTTIHARAEEVGHQPRYRDGFDIVTARAVSSLPALLELGLPLLRAGGHLVLPKGTDINDEMAAGNRAARILGGDIVSSHLLPEAGSMIETRLVIARKSSPTPATYPRRSGIPSKSPLGSDAAPHGSNST